MTSTGLANAIKAQHEEDELDALVEVLGDAAAQHAVAVHQLPALVAASQLQD